MVTVQPAAHGGIEGEVDVFDEDFIVFEVGLGGARALDDFECLGGDDVAGGAGGEDDGLVGGGHVHGSLGTKRLNEPCFGLLVQAAENKVIK